MGNNDLDLFHNGHYLGMIIDAAAGLLRANLIDENGVTSCELHEMMPTCVGARCLA